MTYVLHYLLIKIMKKSTGPKVEIKTSCYDCKFLLTKKDGEYNYYIPDGAPSLIYSCKYSRKTIGYLSDANNTPDWCEFKLINIENIIKGMLKVVRK